MTQQQNTPAQGPLLEREACIICGHVPGTVIRVSEDEKKEYLRSILGNTLFKKTYKLFDGQVTLTFSAVSQNEAKYLNYALRAEKREGSLMADQVDRMSVKCLFYLREVNGQDFGVPGMPEDLGTSEQELEKLVELFHERFGHMPEQLCSTLVECMTKFFSLLMHLSNGGLDENFYKGVGLE